MQDEVFPDVDDFGRIFYNQAVMSANGIPQIAVMVHQYGGWRLRCPAMSDETVIVKGTGTIFLGGPAGKSCDWEEVSAEELVGLMSTPFRCSRRHCRAKQQNALNGA